MAGVHSVKPEGYHPRNTRKDAKKKKGSFRVFAYFAGKYLPVARTTGRGRAAFLALRGKQLAKVFLIQLVDLAAETA